MPGSRGHGRTANPAGALGCDQMADDVAAFCATLAYLQMVRGLGFPQRGTLDLQEVERAMGDWWPTLRTAHHHARGDDAFRAYLAQISELWYSVPGYTDAQLASIDVPALGDRGRPRPARAGRLAAAVPPASARRAGGGPRRRPRRRRAPALLGVRPRLPLTPLECGAD